jgi:hypothetical protein
MVRQRAGILGGNGREPVLAAACCGTEECSQRKGCEKSTGHEHNNARPLQLILVAQSFKRASNLEPAQSYGRRSIFEITFLETS